MRMFIPFGGFMSVFMVLFFIAFFGILISLIVNALKQYTHNEASPILTVTAKIVTKRARVTHHTHAGQGHSHLGSNTDYYVTFEVESGSRIELAVPGKEYGLLAEQDMGVLTFQGTRYKGFERKITEKLQ